MKNSYTSTRSRKSMKITCMFLAMILVFSQVFTALPAYAQSGTGSTYSKIYDGTAYNTGSIPASSTIKSSLVTKVNDWKNGGWGRNLIADQAIDAIDDIFQGSTTVADLISKSNSIIKFSLADTGANNANAGNYTATLSVSLGIYVETIFGSTNYDIIPNQVLTTFNYTINAKPLTVTTLDKEIQEGQELSEVTLQYSVSGTVGQDTVDTFGTSSYVVNGYDAATSVANQTYKIGIDLSHLGSLNSNYTFVGATVNEGTLRVIENNNFSETVNLTQNSSYTYNTKDQTQTVKENFVSEIKNNLPTGFESIASLITVNNVNVSNTVKDAGTYNLYLNITGGQVGEYDEYSITFNQSVKVNEFTGVNTMVNSQLGEFNSTLPYDVYVEGNIPSVGTNLLGFYLTVPQGTSNDIVNELKNAGLTLSVSKDDVISVNISSLTNYTVTQNTATLVDNSVITGLIDGLSQTINSTISNYISEPINLGSFTKEFDGRAFADLEGDEMTSFTNDILSEIVDVLEDLTGKFESLNLPDNVELPQLPDVNIGSSIVNEINKVIAQINSLINTAESTVDGATGTFDDVMGTLNSFGTISFGLKISESGSGLANTVNAGDSTTLTLSLELSFEVDVINLLEDNGMGAFAFLVPDSLKTVTIPVSVSLANFTAAVKALPVTIYFDETVTDFTDNGGLFPEYDPRVMESQLLADHYVTVNPINYLILTSAVKTELSGDVLDSATAHTLSNNYDVTIKGMSEDPTYGEFASDVKDAIDFIDDKVTQYKELAKQIADKVEELKNKGIEDYNRLVAEINELIEKAEQVKQQILDSKDSAEQIIDELIKALEDKFNSVDFDGIKDTLKDYANEAFDTLIDGLDEKLKELADKALEALDGEIDKAINKFLEEFEKLGLDEKYDILKEEAEKAVNDIINTLQTTFPVSVDLGSLTKEYDQEPFGVSDTGYAQKLLALVNSAKDEVDGFDLTALSDIVLTELIVNSLPEEAVSAYTVFSNIMGKLNIDISKMEKYVVDAINDVDNLKNQAEDILNAEIDKLSDEFVKLQNILVTADGMTLGQIKAEILKLNNKYITISFGGDIVVENVPGDEVTFSISANLLGKNFEVVKGTLNLNITAIPIDVTVFDQTIDEGESISPTEFVVTTDLSDSLMAEANSSISLVLNDDGTTIEARLNSKNFILNAVDGTLTVEKEDDNTGGDDDNTGGEDDNTGGEDDNTGGEDDNTGGDDDNTGGDDGNTGGDDGNTGGTTGGTGGTTGGTGGTTGGTGGTTGTDGDDADDDLEEIADEDAPTTDTPEEEGDVDIADITGDDSDSDSTNTEEIDDEQNPLDAGIDVAGANNGNGKFTVLNLVFAVITILLGAYVMISHFTSQNAGSLGIKLITLVPLAISAILTFLTQNFAGAVIIADLWTVVFAVVMLAQVLASVVAIKFAKQDQNLNSDFD